MFFKNCEGFFAFFGVIFGTSNISFDNSMQWMNKNKDIMWKNIVWTN